MDNFEKIEKEYEDFRKEVLLLSKEDIFDNAYKINFYTEIFNFMECMYNDDKEYKVSIAELYDFYLEREFSSIATFEDIEDLIEEYEGYYEN